MGFNKDNFFDTLDGEEHKWSSAYGPTLASMLSTEEMLAALTVINKIVQIDNNSMRALNFTSQEDIAKAIRLQGRGDGVLAVLQMLADCAGEELENGS